MSGLLIIESHAESSDGGDVGGRGKNARLIGFDHMSKD